MPRNPEPSSLLRHLALITRIMTSSLALAGMTEGTFGDAARLGCFDGLSKLVRGRALS